jgi:hypothetical protein
MEGDEIGPSCNNNAWATNGATPAMIDHLFRDHPASVGETYFEHMAHAFRFGVVMILGGLACLLHGLVPGFCTRTGSDCIRHLHQRMVTHRRANPSSLAQGQPDWVI